jgi:hypothetical protein
LVEEDKFEFWLNQCESRGEERERKREEIKISLPEDVAFSSNLFFLLIYFLIF